jgi:putative nucleotidyltransferase with HDIG domain
MPRLNESFKKFESVKELPTIPETLSSILALITDPNSSVADLARVMELDQSLTAKVLRMVNSAFYGFYRQVTTVRDAAVILGFNEIRILALTVSMFDVFQASSSRWERGRFWEHSLVVGMATESLAKLAKLDQKEAFVAGLLHDLGKVAFDFVLGEKWSDLVVQAGREGIPLNELEKSDLGVDHGELGAWLGEKWRLPEGIIATMQFHHRTDDLKHEARVCVAVRLANSVVKAKGIGSSGNPCVEPVEDWMLSRLDLSETDLEEMDSHITSDLKSIQAAAHHVAAGRR